MSCQSAAGGHSKEAMHGRTQRDLHNKIHTKFGAKWTNMPQIVSSEACWLVLQLSLIAVMKNRNYMFENYSESKTSRG